MGERVAGEINEEGLLQRLRGMCHGQSQSAVALSMRVSLGHLNDVLHKRRGAGPAILKALGLRKVVSYVPLDVGGKTEGT